MVAAEKLKMTYAEYLAAEETAKEKHDFLAGEVFAMSGGTLEHSALASSCARILGNALAAKGCIVFESNARVRRAEADFSCYPDVTVVCGGVKRASDDPNGIVNPTVIVEVLSDSTESYDRGEKARQYRQIASLQEFVLVSQARRSVEVFRRNAQGRFELFEWAAGVAELQSVGASIALDALYADAEALRAQG